MTHRYFIATVLATALTITGIQAIGGVSAPSETPNTHLAQKQAPEVNKPAS